MSAEVPENVFELSLIPWQAKPLAGWIRGLCVERRHALCVCAVPAITDEGVTWNLQFQAIDQRTSRKVLKLLKAERSPNIKREPADTTC